jgi:hypothetical protein
MWLRNSVITRSRSLEAPDIGSFEGTQAPGSGDEEVAAHDKSSLPATTQSRQSRSAVVRGDVARWLGRSGRLPTSRFLARSARFVGLLPDGPQSRAPLVESD